MGSNLNLHGLSSVVGVEVRKGEELIMQREGAQEVYNTLHAEEDVKTRVGTERQWYFPKKITVNLRKKRVVLFERTLNPKLFAWTLHSTTRTQNTTPLTLHCATPFTVNPESLSGGRH